MACFYPEVCSCGECPGDPADPMDAPGYDGPGPRADDDEDGDALADNCETLDGCCTECGEELDECECECGDCGGPLRTCDCAYADEEDDEDDDDWDDDDDEEDD